MGDQGREVTRKLLFRIDAINENSKTYLHRLLIIDDLFLFGILPSDMKLIVLFSAICSIG